MNVPIVSFSEGSVAEGQIEDTARVQAEADLFNQQYKLQHSHYLQTEALNICKTNLKYLEN